MIQRIELICYNCKRVEINLSLEFKRKYPIVNHRICQILKLEKSNFVPALKMLVPYKGKLVILNDSDNRFLFRTD